MWQAMATCRTEIRTGCVTRDKLDANSWQLNLVSKVHGAYMGHTWGRQDPGGPHVGPMNLAIRVGPWNPGRHLIDMQMWLIKFVIYTFLMIWGIMIFCVHDMVGTVYRNAMGIFLCNSVYLTGMDECDGAMHLLWQKYFSQNSYAMVSLKIIFVPYRDISNFTYLTIAYLIYMFENIMKYISYLILHSPYI